MMRNLFILYFVLYSTIASANLQICPRMPVATAVSNQFVTSISAAGATTLAQPAFTNISGSVAASQLPNPSASTLGGVQSYAAVSNQWINTISTSGVPSSTQPAFSNLSGSIATSQVNSGTNAGATTFFRGDNTWAAPTAITAPVTTQTFASGSSTYNKDYTFVITSGSATVGATYTNNGVTFTVYATVASATQVVMSGSGAPAASGTLTKASGTGDSTLTFSAALAPLWLRIRMVGGGGGGSGTGTGTSMGNGGNAGNTTFGTFTAGGGVGGTSSGGGAGGTVSGCSVVNLVGGSGAGRIFIATAIPGVQGGGTVFGGFPGSSEANGGNCIAPAANTGVGGGGPGKTTSNQAGGGGGGGGYCETIISSPSATYSYGVGTVGSAGSAGTSGLAGCAGSAGVIIVEEHYQ